MMYKVLVEHSVEVDVISCFAKLAQTNSNAIDQIHNDQISGISPTDSKVLVDELTACAWEVVEQWARGTNSGPAVVPHSYYVTGYLLDASIEIGNEWGKDQFEPWLLNLTCSMRCQFDVRMRPKATIDDVVRWLAVNSDLEKSYKVTIKNTRNKKLCLTTNLCGRQPQKQNGWYNYTN